MKRVVLVVALLVLFGVTTGCNKTSSKASESTSKTSNTTSKSSSKSSASSSHNTSSKGTSSGKAEGSSGNSSVSYGTTSVVASTVTYAISEEKAKEILAQHLITGETGMKLYVDGIAALQNRKYYVLQFIKSVSGQQLIRGFFIVDTETGGLFEEYMASSKYLLPLNAVKEVHQTDSVYSASRKKAYSYLEKYVNLPVPGLLSYNGRFERDGKQYDLVIKSKVLNSKDADFYYVSVSDGRVYQWDLAADTLISLKKLR